MCKILNIIPGRGGFAYDIERNESEIHHVYFATLTLRPVACRVYIYVYIYTIKCMYILRQLDVTRLPRAPFSFSRFTFVICPYSHCVYLILQFKPFEKMIKYT